MAINIELPGCNLKNLKRELSINFSFKSPCVVFAHFAKNPSRYTLGISALLYLCGIINKKCKRHFPYRSLWFNLFLAVPTA